MVISRFEVYLMDLDPTVGREMQKTRPCIVVSPDDMHRFVSTVIIAPLTSHVHGYPFRVPCKFKRKSGEVVLDQIRTVDRKRLIKKLGILDAKAQEKIKEVLVEMFSE